MKKIIILTTILFSLTSLFAIKSFPSDTVGFSTLSCTNYEDMDYNYISYPLNDGERINSNDVDPLGENFRSIHQRDVENEGWRTSNYFPFFGNIWLNTFPVEQGVSYMISSIQHDFKFIKSL